MNIVTRIAQAIEKQCKVTLDYKKEGVRVLCPHALYVSSTGKTLLDAYQLSGYTSQPDKIPDWRQLDISQITDFCILDETFDVDQRYNPNSDRYKKAIAKI